VVVAEVVAVADDAQGEEVEVVDVDLGVAVAPAAGVVVAGVGCCRC